MSDFDVVSSEDEKASIITVGRAAEVPQYGNLRPFFRGRLLWSPQASHWILVLLTLLGGTLLFVFFWGSLRFTDPHILRSRWMTQLPDVIVAILAVVSATLLLCTSLTNPGILPKNNIPPSLGSPAAKEYCTTLPYCMTCHIYRPSQAGHCRRCNNCVAQFDHHCRPLGCCIGELNKRYFLLFLVSITMYNTVISVCLGYFVVVVLPKENLARYILSAIGLAVTAILSLALAGYLVYNLRLIRMGLLHREYMKGAAARTRSRAGFFVNLVQIFCPKREHPPL
ncbi:DHHC palmitoyltransferase [Novymonas esmeraldas]|uniref:Palmitoyltransferase n=1 Tax=Novymonas esmeraldas TaxID=1808958 RepID=A0AAW0EPP9_9TRYP